MLISQELFSIITINPKSLCPGDTRDWNQALHALINAVVVICTTVAYQTTGAYLTKHRDRVIGSSVKELFWDRAKPPVSVVEAQPQDTWFL